MKYWFGCLIVICSYSSLVFSQPESVKSAFPPGTIFHQNIPYASDTVKKHLLDVYLPAGGGSNFPLVIWVHGGAWMHGDKYADMGYMKNTINAILRNGFALASIDYRPSTARIFPAQIQDCYQAVEFLFGNAATYKLDKSRFSLMGFSAGGHLASLLGLSSNNAVPEFHVQSKKHSFKIKAVIDFYGPSDFMLFFGMAKPDEVDNPIGILLGSSPILRPDISKLASPVTYVDANDPPFLIVHGEKDAEVPLTHSYLLKSYLDLAKVKNELIIVKDAPHFGEMFDTDEIRTKVIMFLKTQLK
ncbi:alpha/beta hydrolase [Chryseolinea sp. H1M3-3]|uniref:alpha/beta hydrolase n=1 Tax=Chryseolinea sp. H1M3-3 TaxID=3034144 RepID=UPI0023EAA5A0|nr:alpha/beta hydrolase [Chryseolinea sp. H1M3-3]